MFSRMYLERGSVLHNLDFWTKLLCFLLLIPLATFLASPSVLLLNSLFSLFLVRLSKVRFAAFWKQVRLYYLFLTAGIMILSLAFSHGDLPSRAMSGVIISARFAILTSLGMLFSMITDPIEIPLGLLRIRVPHRYGVTVMVAYRMVPLITRKVSSVIETQKARGARLSFSPVGLRRLPVQVMSLVVPIVYSTLETSVGLSDTLLARGYNPNAPITIPPTRLRLWDFGMVFVSAALLVLAVWPSLTATIAG